MRNATMTWATAGLALTLLLGVAGATPVYAQSSPWTPWLGCWELEHEAEAGEETTLEGNRMVCLDAGAEPSAVEMTTWVDDQVVLLQEVVADGEDRAVAEGGCEGIERARFSADGQRILMSAELSCSEQDLRTSGIGLLPSSSTWTDIQVSEVEGQRELLVRRYRRADRGAEDSALDRALLMRTARQSASAPLDVEDVIEAAALVDAAAVEAMLLESGDEFAVDADLLLQLARAEVPENVIDLMVALSYPDYFAVHEGDSEETWDRHRYRRSRWGWGPAFYGYGYGYYDPYFAPFGYRYYYGRPGGGTVIVRGPRFGGKVVAGKGYTRISTRQDLGGAGGGLARIFGGGSDRGRSAVGRGSGDRTGGSTVTPGGSSSGSSGTRTAKPRGGSGSGSAKPKSGSGSGTGH